MNGVPSHAIILQGHATETCTVKPCHTVHMAFEWEPSPRILRQSCPDCRQPFTEIILILPGGQPDREQPKKKGAKK